MPLETERNLGLALSAEADDLLEIVIWLLIYFIGHKRQDHFVPLLQNGVRLDLVHESAFTFKSFTH